MTEIHSSIGERSRLLTRLAIGFWIALLVVITTKNLIKPYEHTVFFPAYAMTGRTWWYPEMFTEQEKNTYQSRQYAPFFSELIGPFCMLPDRLAGTVWTLASIAVLVTGFHRLLTKVVPGGVSRSEWAVAFLLLPWVGLSSLYNGQANILITGCLLWAIAAVRTRWWFVVGLCLAVPSCIKTYPIAMAMVLMALYPRKLIPRFFLAVTGLTLLPFLLHPADAVIARYQGWITFLTSGEHYTTGMLLIDLRSLLKLLGLGISPRAYIPVQVITGGLVLACVLAARRRGVGERQTLTLAYLLTTMWLVLFGPATEPATYLLAGPAVAWILIEAHRRLEGRGDRSDRVSLVGLCAAAAFAGPLQTSILGEPIRRWLLAAKLAPLGLAVLFAHRIVIGFRMQAPAEFPIANQEPRKIA